MISAWISAHITDESNAIGNQKNPDKLAHCIRWKLEGVQLYWTTLEIHFLAFFNEYFFKDTKGFCDSFSHYFCTFFYFLWSLFVSMFLLFCLVWNVSWKVFTPIFLISPPLSNTSVVVPSLPELYLIFVFLKTFHSSERPVGYFFRMKQVSLPFWGLLEFESFLRQFTIIFTLAFIYCPIYSFIFLCFPIHFSPFYIFSEFAFENIWQIKLNLPC